MNEDEQITTDVTEEEQKRLRSAKRFALAALLHPIIFIVTFFAAAILEFPTNRGALYVLLFMISIFIMILGYIPEGIYSIIALVKIRPLKKKGIAGSKPIFVFALIGLLIAILHFLFDIFRFYPSLVHIT